MSAPSQRPLMATWRNCAAGVLLYRRFQLSSIILLGGSASSGFLALGAGLGSSSPSAAAYAGLLGLSDSARSGRVLSKLGFSGFRG